MKKVLSISDASTTYKGKSKINTNRKNARWAGAFYIIATVAPILAFSFVRFLGGGAAGGPAPDYLVNLSVNESQVIIGMLIELIWALAVVGIVVTLFPILKKYNEALALGFSSLRFIEVISTIIHSIILLSLLTLSQEYTAAGIPDASYYQTAGKLLLAAREWTLMIGSGLVWSLSALILNYILYQSKLIPRWLSVWGLVGATLSFAAYLLQFFSISLGEVFFLPIAVQEMVFAVWLIVKGFNSPAIVSPSSNIESSEINEPLV
jgi:hypothetical protein